MINAESLLWALGEIDDQLIQEAGAPRKRNVSFLKRWGAVAACICLLLWGIGLFSPSGVPGVTACAVGTGQRIDRGGAVMETGMIRDGGEMVGHPLRFYLTGKRMDQVRFSCEKGKLDFTDWTEQRAEYGLAGNFVVNYGADEEDYRSLVLEWVPESLIQTMTEGTARRIADLPEELRTDKIVMEITFSDGSGEVQAMDISLRDDGRFVVSCGVYALTEADTFVQRSDAEPIPREELYAPPEAPADGSVPPEAEQAARAYYADTVLEPVSLHPVRVTEREILFEVRVRKNNILQEPFRRITLQISGDSWKVVNEGY